MRAFGSPIVAHPGQSVSAAGILGRMRDEPGPALRRKVRIRAQRCCEYCGPPDSASVFPHEPDHIIALKHGGKTTEANLTYACFECNRAKGSDIASVDSSTGVIDPLTATGRVAIALL